MAIRRPLPGREAILEARERGVALRDQTVLFRNGHHSDALELELTRRDIPFVKYGGRRFLESAPVKDEHSSALADDPDRAHRFAAVGITAEVDAGLAALWE